MKTIKIHNKTHEELEKLFMGRNTFDGVINKLIIDNKLFQNSLKKLSEDERRKIKKKMEEEYERHL